MNPGFLQQAGRPLFFRPPGPIERGGCRHSGSRPQGTARPGLRHHPAPPVRARAELLGLSRSAQPSAVSQLLV